MQSVCKVRSRLEGFLGPFFLATAGILATGSQRPRRPRRHRTSRGLTRLHGGTGHHEASRGFMAAQRFTGHHGASQGLTRLHGGSGASRRLSRPHGIHRGSSAARRPPCVTGASLSGRALWPGDLRASAASARALRVLAIAPHTPVRSAPLEFTGDRRGPTLSGKAEPSAASALVNPQTVQLRLPRLCA